MKHWHFTLEIPQKTHNSCGGLCANKNHNKLYFTVVVYVTLCL